MHGFTSANPNAQCPTAVPKGCGTSHAHGASLAVSAETAW